MNRNKLKLIAFWEILWGVSIVVCLWVNGARIDMAGDQIKELEGKVSYLESLVPDRTLLLPDEGFEITSDTLEYDQSAGGTVESHTLEYTPDPTADVTITLDGNGKVVEGSGTVTGTFEDFIDADGDKVEIKPAAPNVTLPGTPNPPENQIPDVTLPGGN